MPKRYDRHQEIGDVTTTTNQGAVEVFVRIAVASVTDFAIIALFFEQSTSKASTHLPDLGGFLSTFGTKMSPPPVDVLHGWIGKQIGHTKSAGLMQRFWLDCNKVVSCFWRPSKHRSLLRVPPLFGSSNILLDILSSMHAYNVCFEIVQAWPHFLGLGTIWVKTLPEAIVWR